MYRDESNAREKKRTSLVTALLVGSLAGGMTALLVAPMSGRRLRKTLARGGRRLRRRATDSAVNLQDTGQRVLDRASESLMEIADEARQLAKSWSDR